MLTDPLTALHYAANLRLLGELTPPLLTKAYVRRLMGRNVVWLLEVEQQRVILKQFLAHQGAMSFFLTEESALGTLREVDAILAPRMKASDSRNRILAIDAKSINTLWQVFVSGAGSYALAYMAGELLARLHKSVDVEQWPSGKAQAGSGRDIEDYPSPGQLLLLQAAERLGLIDLLANENEVPGKRKRALHGDVRLENIVVDYADQPHVVRLIDFETACVSEPEMDVGGLLHSFLVIELRLQSRDELLSESHSRSRSGMASVGAALEGYEQLSGESLDTERLGLWIARRLLTTAFEFERYREMVSWQSLAQVELAFALLVDPEQFWGRLTDSDDATR